MATRKYSLTDAHRAQLGPWAERWISNAMSTRAMDGADRAAMIEAIEGLYRAADLTPPPRHRIVFAPSPLVARVAGGFAAAIWYLRRPDVAMDSAAATIAYATRTDNAIRAAISPDAHAVIYAATAAATKIATSDATEDAIRDATCAATYDATHAMVDAVTHAATYTATGAAAHAATAAAAAAATAAATYYATAAATHAVTNAATSDATVAARVDIATHAATAAATSDATKDAMRDAAATWYASDLDIARAARELVPPNPSLAVQCAHMAWSMWSGGNQWSGLVAYLSFFRHVAGLPLDYTKWHHYEQAAIHGGPRVMHREFCIVSDRPELLLVDVDHRPHGETGPFCRWRDGFALYAWHGVYVPAWVIEHPERITLDSISAEANAEVRRAMIEKRGWDWYLEALGAEPRHRDNCGDLYRAEIDGVEVDIAVVTNSTPESNGSRKRYALLLPPSHDTARAAVADSFGVDAQWYAPARET